MVIKEKGLGEEGKCHTVYCLIEKCATSMLTLKSAPPKGSSQQTMHTSSALKRLDFSHFSVINSGQCKSFLLLPFLGEVTLLELQSKVIRFQSESLNAEGKGNRPEGRG